MAKPKSKPIRPKKADRKQKAPAKHTWQMNDIGLQIKAGIKQQLKKNFDEFLESGRAEEVRFLAQVFQERGSAGGDYFPKKRHDYEVPLFSAIQTAITDCIEHVIALPDGEMLRPVSDFIEGLERAAENDSQGLTLKPRPDTAIRTRREADIKHFIETFCTKATNDDLFFLETVLARWAGILEFNPEDQPESPIMSALQYELDHQNWLVKVPAATGQMGFRTLIALARGSDWLAQFLAWVAEKHETLSPCEVGKEAFRHQQAFDKAAVANAA